MIKISVLKENDIIKIEGHSGYSEAGSDIVCASVSSIAITSINAILKFDEEALKYDKKDGYLQIEILKHNDIVDKLILNMLELFKELSEQYKDYIKIK